MLENRDYMRQPQTNYRWSATVVLLAVNITVFVLQKILEKTLANPFFVDNYFALSLEGLRHGYVWQLLTFQVLHAGWLHLFFNCWALFVFGREVEEILGVPRFLLLYFSSGVIGGLFQEFTALIWPNYFGSAVVGASAGIFGIVSAFAMFFPERQLTLLIFFVIPVNMRAKFLLWISLLLAALGISFPNSFFGGNVAHAAHLGGILAGLAFVRMREEFQFRLWRPFGWMRSKKSGGKIPGWPKSEDTDDMSEEFISREVDPILDKISEHGIQSLTERERKILEAARSKMAKR
jgi:membrane associated rhomboid family serine protease